MKQRYLLLIFPILLFGLNACKKGANTAPTVTILGKWYVTKHNAVFFRNGVQIGTTLKTSFGPYDFAEYFTDGTGILSIVNNSAAGLSKFTYTLNGNTLTQVNYNDKAVPETITNLTATSLAIHYQIFVADPDDPTAIDKEVHDFYFARSN